MPTTASRIEWVVNYPVQSIWSTPGPFTKARHTLWGKRVSLDELESWLREMSDPRVYAALVCAASNCPPLRREAYIAERLDEQLDDNVREWLADPSLNTFYPAQAKAEISPIFKWFGKDLTPILAIWKNSCAQNAPPVVKDALAKGSLASSSRLQLGVARSVETRRGLFPAAVRR
jgi:hypothetical protein